MLDVLESLERVAVWLSPIVVVLPGLVLTGLGLFIWLGGLGFRRLLMGLVGVLAGAVVGYGLGGGNLVATLSAAVALAFVATLFQRFFAAGLLGVLAAAAAFFVVAWPSLHAYDAGVAGGADASTRQTAGESLEIVEGHWADLRATFRQAGQRLSALRWTIVAAAGLALLVSGLAFRSLAGALSCAATGTVLVFVGLVLLLMYKGAVPVTRIETRPVFYGVIFGSMVAFGTLEQFVLCRRAEKHQAKSNKGDNKQGNSKRRRRDR